MRTWAFLLVLAACSPEIDPGAYYCGPSADCPPKLACDGASDLCVLPAQAGPFVCPAGTNANEPDNDTSTAVELGTTGCGAQSFSDTGCLDKASDVDYLSFTAATACTSIQVYLRAPAAWATPAVELLDDSGTVVASGAVTTDIDATGEMRIGLTGALTGGAHYYVRVRLADGTPDCDGTCAYTWYQLSIL